MHKANSHMALFEKMGGGKFSTSHIIDGNRAEVLNSAWAIQEDDGNSTLAKPLQITGITLDWGNQDSSSPLLLKYLKIVTFLF